MKVSLTTFSFLNVAEQCKKQNVKDKMLCASMIKQDHLSTVLYERQVQTIAELNGGWSTLCLFIKCRLMNMKWNMPIG